MLIQLQKEKTEKKSDFYQELAEKSKAIAQNYTKEKRFEHFKELTADLKGKKIVLISDFINKIGGIETYLHDVKTLLEKEGYKIKLFGSNCPKGRIGKLKKLFGIGLSALNLWEAIRFSIFIRKEKPDLIRYHSMIRRNGRLPLWFTRRNTAKKWMMYHDFGYFTPYPHQLSDTKQIKTPLSLKHYLAMANTKNPIKKFLICGKYLTLSCLKKQIDLHLVPSAFIVPIVEKSFGLPIEKISDFNHFIQE